MASSKVLSYEFICGDFENFQLHYLYMYIVILFKVSQNCVVTLFEGVSAGSIGKLHT